jgi:SMI1-KNR4 cell-wall
MAMAPDLHYDPKSIVGPLNENEVKDFQDWLHGSGYPIRFELPYIQHVKEHHGGIPAKRYFRTAIGTADSITRFLNFLGAGSDPVLQQYSVECTWSNINEHLGKHLMPFAELFAGDMLCFDYTKGGRPEIVVWFHELSEPGQPHTEFVSKNFDEFLDMLDDKPGNMEK